MKLQKLFVTLLTRQSPKNLSMLIYVVLQTSS